MPNEFVIFPASNRDAAFELAGPIQHQIDLVETEVEMRGLTSLGFGADITPLRTDLLALFCSSRPLRTVAPKMSFVHASSFWRNRSLGISFCRASVARLIKRPTVVSTRS